MRRIGLIVGILLLVVLWAQGIGWATGIPWEYIFSFLAVTSCFFFYLHYQNGMKWMIASLEAEPVQSPVASWLASKAGLRREPHLFVTRPLASANAFTISGAYGDAIFVSPEIWEAPDEILVPVLAHEMAHIRHRDSYVTGFIAAFAQVVSSIGRTWMVLLAHGLFGCLILLFIWPVLFSVQLLSALTLAVYHPFVAALIREKEFLADEAAARLTSPQEVIYALQAVDRYNRRGFMGLFMPQGGGPLSTHPPLEQRVARIRGTFGAA